MKVPPSATISNFWLSFIPGIVLHCVLEPPPDPVLAHTSELASTVINGIFFFVKDPVNSIIKTLAETP